MKYCLWLFVFFLLSLSASGKGYFDYTPIARTAYNNIMDLRFKEAEVQLKKMRSQEPDNLISHHLENYMDLLKVYLDENKEQLSKMKASKTERLNTISKGDTSSPYYLYLQADIRMQWALASLKVEGYIAAFMEINRAFALLDQNEKKFPDFMPNKKNLGILHALVSSLPYKQAISFFSNLQGDFEQSKREIQEVINYAKKNDFVFEKETYIYYSYVMLQFGNDDETAWNILNNSKLNPKSSPTDAFVLANLAMRTGKNDKAIEILQQYPKGSQYFPFPYLDYMLGRAKLQRLDSDADQYLKQYLKEFDGQNYIKETYKRLAWHELVHDRPEGYVRYMKEALNKGVALVEADEGAYLEAKTGIAPHPDILRARLLFDGGYYQRAYNVLILRIDEKMEQARHEIELYYFLGRTSHKLKKYDNALLYYQKAIELGQNKPWYFACRAALEIGNIYEIQSKNEAAKEAFKKCLTIKPEEQRFSLHQNAKAGLQRLK
jgi:tetratricopeptide (TPR) repeat protein